MIEVHKALKIIKDQSKDLGTETVPLANSLGRILKEDWFTDRDLPPYHRVTMDGIAIRFADYHSGTRIFPIQEIAAAGDPQKELTTSHACLEVMTGSILPKGTDTVIRYEDLQIENQKAKLLVELIKNQQNVHFKGSDRKKDSLVARKDKIISSAEIGLGASIGKYEVLVAKLPRAIVISTGNELVPIDATPLEHQIRKSNVHNISSILDDLKIEHTSDHLSDDKVEVKSKLEKYLIEYDLILLSGGVSKGKFDYLPEVFRELGAEKLFHKVAQRPGKPFWFGTYKQCKIFAFPGNPVSTFVCMHRYFIDWLEQSLGTKLRQPIYAELAEDVNFKPDLTYFLEVKISYSKSGKILATPQKGNGSGDLANLVEADAIIELPKGKNVYEKGQVYPIYFYR